MSTRTERTYVTLGSVGSSSLLIYETRVTTVHITGFYQFIRLLPFTTREYIDVTVYDTEKVFKRCDALRRERFYVPKKCP